jgi:hypothetical protein
LFPAAGVLFRLLLLLLQGGGGGGTVVVVVVEWVEFSFTPLDGSTDERGGALPAGDLQVSPPLGG